MRGPLLALTEENDCFAGTDRHYTQGFRAVYLGSESSAACWLRQFAAYGIRVDSWRWGFEIGQSLFTPENLTATEPLPNDRPYAGWLYAGPVLQRRGVDSIAGLPALENVQLQLGVVGPGALARQTQESAHFIGGFQKAAGWQNQLGNEPGGALKYERTWRFASGALRDWNAELLPQAGGSLGNVDTSARFGAMLRAGWRLPDDFGVQNIDSLAIADGGSWVGATSRRLGFYIFARAEGRAVGYNEFLDGNLFRDSPHITKRPFVGELQGGVVFIFARMELSLMLIYRTKEFDGQDCEDTFGSVSLQVDF